LFIIFCKIHKKIAKYPEVKKTLWGGEFWSDDYYVDTVGRHGNESVISNYIKSRGKEKEYKKICSQQLSLFGWTE
jgi:REP element-mobilizing transposase RayT